LAGFSCWGLAVDKEDPSRSSFETPLITLDGFGSTVPEPIQEDPEDLFDDDSEGDKEDPDLDSSDFDVSLPIERTTFAEARPDNWIVSRPKNNEVLLDAPNSVSVDFSIEVEGDYRIRISRGGEVLDDSNAILSNTSLQLLTPFSEAKPGNYKVDYSVCFVDGTCGEGSFGFTVDPTADPSEITNEEAIDEEIDEVE